MVLVHYKSARAHSAFLQFTSFDYESFHHFFECVFVHVCENTVRQHLLAVFNVFAETRLMLLVLFSLYLQ